MAKSNKLSEDEFVVEFPDEDPKDEDIKDDEIDDIDLDYTFDDEEDFEDD